MSPSYLLTQYIPAKYYLIMLLYVTSDVIIGILLKGYAVSLLLLLFSE